MIRFARGCFCAFRTFIREPILMPALAEAECRARAIGPSRDNVIDGHNSQSGGPSSPSHAFNDATSTEAPKNTEGVLADISPGVPVKTPPPNTLSSFLPNPENDMLAFNPVPDAPQDLLDQQEMGTGGLVASLGAELGHRDGDHRDDIGRHSTGNGRTDPWSRNDIADWTPELARAYAALEHGKDWGTEFDALISVFFDFEAACGYEVDGGQISVTERPEEVEAWIIEGRNWAEPFPLEDVGAWDRPGSFAYHWWRWWRSLQPDGRLWAGGFMSCPDDCNWEPLASLYGSNGLLEVIATLLWWGHAAEDEPDLASDWVSAVADVTWVIEQLMDLGVDLDKGPDGWLLFFR